MPHLVRIVIAGLALLACAITSVPAQAVLIKLGDGTGNTTPPADDPGLAHVGVIGTLSGVYLGNGWIITANHVGILPITLGGTTYEPAGNAAVRLTTPGGNPADLRLIKIDGDPGLPMLNVASISPSLNNSVIMYGNGRGRGAPVTWGGADGWVANGPNEQRWGTNRVAGTNQTALDTRMFLTVFDESGGGVAADEAQSAIGDSGGAVFYKRAGTWELTGIMFAVGLNSSEQPANYALFGNLSLIADLAIYRPEIMSVITQPACSDGFDDDGDGLTDHPADPGCASAADTDERNAAVECDDGLDNDADGHTDWPADPGCTDPTDMDEEDPIVACNDGVDNDGDTLADWPADPGCTSALDATEQNPGIACDDGVDNDGDSLADWPNDPGCDDASDDSEQSPGLVCDDGLDNEGDGLTDHPEDSDCGGDPLGDSEGVAPYVPVTSALGTSALAAAFAWLGLGRARGLTG